MEGEGEGEEMMSDPVFRVETEEKSCATSAKVKAKYCSFHSAILHPKIPRTRSLTAASCEPQLQLDSVVFD